eukprot:CAMPEP_0170419428 /NCGR_PEP_ID=MMETSP0117_2-20130122/34793_1 /TAXON_ID=400756 /ORGANISM="Durinskia baltica, Strain CSIRO CS-38" /LENGTH=49 /DNA_ID=CAMNT_0010677777 /DNA_START=124 /DNA_END=273 /DNA_ORIENTATION=-
MNATPHRIHRRKEAEPAGALPAEGDPLDHEAPRDQQHVEAMDEAAQETW